MNILKPKRSNGAAPQLNPTEHQTLCIHTCPEPAANSLREGAQMAWTTKSFRPMDVERIQGWTHSDPFFHIWNPKAKRRTEIENRFLGVGYMMLEQSLEIYIFLKKFKNFFNVVN